MEKYNQIDNTKKFVIFSIIIVIHFLFLCFIVVAWIILGFKVDYFYSLIKYINEYSEELGKLNYAKKVDLLARNSGIFDFIPKESQKEYKTTHYFGNNFIEDKIERLIKSINKGYILFLTIPYLLRNIYPFLITIICLLLYLCNVQVFLVFICSSTISCILYFFNFGLTSEGSLNMNLISYKNNTRYYWAEFFYNVFYIQ